MVVKERRQYSRFELASPVDIITSRGLLEGEVDNISFGGAYIRCNELPEKNETFDLGILTPGQDYYPVWAKAKMVWSRTYDSESSFPSYGLGASFTEVSEKDIKCLLADQAIELKDRLDTNNNKVESGEDYFYENEHSPLLEHKKTKVTREMSQRTKIAFILTSATFLAVVILSSMFVSSNRNDKQANQIRSLETTVNELEHSLLLKVEQIKARLAKIEKQDQALAEFGNRLAELEALTGRAKPKVVGHSPPTSSAQEAATLEPTAEKPMALTQSAEKESLPPASKILAIQPVVGDEDVDVHIIGDGRLDDYDLFLLADPPRLVLELFGVRSSKVKGPLILDGPWVKKIRMGTHRNKLRVVFDLIVMPEEEVPYHVILEKDRLVVSFQPRSG